MIKNGLSSENESFFVYDRERARTHTQKKMLLFCQRDFFFQIDDRRIEKKN